MKQDYHFTIHKNEEVDNFILRDLKKVQKSILKIFPNTLSILLVGGFGRKEGSFKVTQTEFYPLNDYDIIVILKKINRKIISKKEQLSKFLANQLNIDFVDIIIITTKYFKKPNFLRSILYYESLYGHYIIFDKINIENILPKIDFSLIRTSELHKLLFNRALCLLEAIGTNSKYDFLVNDKMPFDYLVRQTSKAILANCDISLLINKKYHFSYLEKCKKYQELKNVSKKNKKLVRLATIIKLWPERSKIIKKPIIFWEDAINLYSRLTRKFFSKYMNLSIDYLWLDFRNEYFNMFNSKIFFLKTKLEKFLPRTLSSFSINKYIIWDPYRFDEISISQLILIDSYKNQPLNTEIKMLLSKMLKIPQLYTWDEYRKISIKLWYKYKH